MNACSDGIITVDAKSGRVSRSRNWAIDLAEPTISADFFFSALYPLVSAFEFAASVPGSDLATTVPASGPPR